MVIGTEMQSDECFAKIGDVGLTAADMSTFETITQKMQGEMPPQMRNRTDAFDFAKMQKAIGFAGIPVETTTFRDGKPASRTTLTSVAHDAVAASAFEVPAGYTKRGPDGGDGGPSRQWAAVARVVAALVVVARGSGGPAGGPGTPAPGGQ